MEKIKISINDDYCLDYTNVYGEKSHDYMSKGEYFFDFGRIYGIICEQGAGGEGLSRIITSSESNKASIYIDGVENNKISECAWYVGKPVKVGRFFLKELSIRKALEMAIKENGKYQDISTVIEEFHLTYERLNYSLSKVAVWEKWRASLAIGYVLDKKIFCFPWMDSLYFYDCMINSSVFRFFRKITNDRGVIFLPTSRRQNVQGLVDEIIEIECPRFKKSIVDSDYFKEHFVDM